MFPIEYSMYIQHMLKVFLEYEVTVGIVASFCLLLSFMITTNELLNVLM
jgi:hypothetical protein